MKSNSGIIGPKQTSTAGTSGIASGEYGTFEQYNRIKNDFWPKAPVPILTYTTGSKAEWMTLRTKHATNTFFNSYGMGINGNANSSANSYPVVTNQAFPATKTNLSMKFAVVKDNSCSDHGICIFKTGTNPVWSWNANNTRIAMQWNCSTPWWYPATGSSDRMSSASSLVTYYVTIAMNLATGYTSTIIRTGSFTGSIVVNDNATRTGSRLTSLSGWSSSSTWDIGFDADQDSTNYISYFKDIEIQAS